MKADTMGYLWYWFHFCRCNGLHSAASQSCCVFAQLCGVAGLRQDWDGPFWEVLQKTRPFAHIDQSVSLRDPLWPMRCRILDRTSESPKTACFNPSNTAILQQMSLGINALWDIEKNYSAVNLGCLFQHPGPLHRNSALWEGKDCPAASFSIFFDQSGVVFAFFSLRNFGTADCHFCHLTFACPPCNCNSSVTVPLIRTIRKGG